MEAYIRNELSVSSELTLAEAAKHSAKLLTWLLDCLEEMKEQQRQGQRAGEEEQKLQLTYTDIECIFKAKLYLNECHARFGEELVESMLLLQCSQGHAAIRSYYNESEGEGITKLCGYIINGTRNGQRHVASIYQLHKIYAELQPAWNIIKELKWSDVNKQELQLHLQLELELEQEVQQMHHLVRRLFRLGSVAALHTALQRALQRIECPRVFLQLFREPKESGLYSRCCIVRQIICDLLIQQATDNATCSFVHNIYRFVGSGQSLHLARFYRCLQHTRFAAAFTTFVFNYWLQRLPHLQLDELQLCSPYPLFPLPLDELLYLTHLLLTPKSPCRSQFYGELRTLPSPLLQRLLELLNKVAFAYS